MSRITLENIGFSYRNHGRLYPALNGLDMTVEDGEFLCVIGRSGCGKSTLLRLIAGLQLPREGSIRIGGRPVTGPDTDRAVVFQNYALFPWMTAEDNVCFAVRQANRSMSRRLCRERSEEFLERVGMLDNRDKYPYQLSGGMCQRVAIARALAMDTDILLLDEPFGALDPRIRRELQELLEQLWKNGEHRKTLVFVTHDMDEALLLGDRILYMESGGRITAEIPVELPRPRSGLSGEDRERMAAMRRQLTELFYRGGGEEESYDTSGL